MNSQGMLQSLDRDELDYQTMLGALREYASPRDKLADLRAKGLIVRAKKGLYVLGEPYRRRPVCRELLANLIYGPSYVSLDYALQAHGLIPERVAEVTSVTTGRSRRFSTPFGVFSFRGISSAAFAVGAARHEVEGERAYLMATPEKALADKLITERNGAPTSRSGLRRYLIEELRIEPEALANLDQDRLARIAQVTGSRAVRTLVKIVCRSSHKGVRHG